ncbi:hypothetical protein BDV06DRAFT_28260 [Aspergillus oleicola]
MTSLNSSTTINTGSTTNTLKTSKTTTTTATETPPPSSIKCTFPDCTFFFRTDKEMKKHKATYPEHEYCTKCDLDCDSEEMLLLHMIKSNKHIVCPICGIEFGSEGGRDRHIRQFHRTTQNLACHGCQETFRSAAGLMRHIEDGQCTAISSDRLLFEQSKKLMRREALETFTAPVAMPSLVDADDDDEGGVPIPKSQSEKSREAMANQPNKNGKSRSLIDEHWPKLNTKDEAEDSIGNLVSFTEIATTINDIAKDVKTQDKSNDKNKENNVWTSKGRELFTPSVVGSGSGAGSLPGSASGTVVVPAPGSLSIGPLDAGLILEEIYRDWNPVNFLDEFTNEYVCACGKRCRTKDGFEKHVLSKSQGSRRMQCPGCLKIFKSTAALIAHCESATTKCNINEGRLYAQIIDEISGGMVQTSGENEDGTIRYVAGQVDLRRKVPVEVDLDKVGW